MRNPQSALTAIVFVVTVLCLSAPAAADPAMDAAIADTWAYADASLHASIGYIEANFGVAKAKYWYPRSTFTSGSQVGKWECTEPNRIYGWMTGHWAGQLWLDWQKTGDANMLQYAKDWTAGIEITKYNPLDHDLGFRFLNSFYLGYTLLDDTTDPGATYRDHARDVVITAAGTLNTRYNNGGVPASLIEAVGRNAWLPPYGIVVDSLANIRLLFAGWDLSGRPTSGEAREWYDHAVSHACTILAQQVRSFGPGDPRAADDGSTYHASTHYDNTTSTPLPYRNDPNFYGKLYYKMTSQGYSDETTWSRGQAWAILGYAQTYSYTRDDANVGALFLNTAYRAARYYISHLPNNYTADTYNHRDGDFVPPTDFDAALGEPVGPWNDFNNDKVYGDRGPALHAFIQRDSWAAAIATCGLLELSTLTPDANLRTLYFDTAEDILWCLMTYDGDSDGKADYLTKGTNYHMGILGNARGAYSSTDEQGFAGADYYIEEALMRYEALVPEPASLAILSLSAGLAMCLRRRRHRRA